MYGGQKQFLMIRVPPSILIAPIITARCNIYISLLCHDASPSVCDGSALVHYS